MIAVILTATGLDPEPGGRRETTRSRSFATTEDADCPADTAYSRAEARTRDTNGSRHH